MKISSLNLNNFGGTEIRPMLESFKSTNGNIDWNSWKKSVKDWWENPKFYDNAKKMYEYIYDNNIDIAVVQEFDYNSPSGKIFTRGLVYLGYALVYPNGFDQQLQKKNQKTITAMFVKYKYYNNPTVNFTKTLRSVEIRINEFIIIGVHVPLGDEEFWEDMINYYENRNTEKLLLVGDMNVFDAGTPQKKKYFELMTRGAVDSWVERKNPNSTSTANTGKRIDYAIMTPLLYSELIEIKVDDTLRNQGTTDHSTIIVNF